ncbi:HNH endonuclease [Gallibacterium anatis]|nr:hypothetical protein [Gallibacterium anatis]
MIKIDLPRDCQNYADVIDSCCSIMRNSNPLKGKIKENKDALLRVSQYYKKTAKNNRLFIHLHHRCSEDCYIRIANNNINQNALLTKDDMIKLYDKYFVEKRDQHNNYYDKIINNAKNPKIHCPFCGGINIPTEIDHFLPKSEFCYYSIFPYNLIPICKDCNQTYKKNFFPENKKEQLIHPYFDNDCFFNEQWLYAEYIDEPNDIGTIRYFVKPPNNWSIDKKDKVEFHFIKFNLAKRFSEQACGSLSDVLDTMKTYKGIGISMNDFEQGSIDSYLNNESRINHWKRALYQAIKNNISTIWRNI